MRRSKYLWIVLLEIGAINEFRWDLGELRYIMYPLYNKQLCQVPCILVIHHLYCVRDYKTHLNKEGEDIIEAK